jgi:hypothetical protein
MAKGSVIDEELLAPLIAFNMNVILAGAIFAAALSAGILVLLEIGRRIGVRQIKEEGETASQGLGAIEGAIFGLLGLILAFSFSGALTRFEARRHLIVEEANDIGTAWLRIDLLPADAQPQMRDLFRRYLDSRIEVYRKVPQMEEVKAELARSANLQSEIWASAISSSRETGTTQAPVLLLPALNAMFDITTTRTEAAKNHPPLVTFAMLGALTLACSLFAGYDMSIRRRLNVLHSIAFAVALSVTAYVIIDLEYPRLGLVQVIDSDQVLIDLRKGMK